MKLASLDEGGACRPAIYQLQTAGFIVVFFIQHAIYDIGQGREEYP